MSYLYECEILSYCLIRNMEDRYGVNFGEDFFLLWGREVIWLVIKFGGELRKIILRKLRDEKILF